LDDLEVRDCVTKAERLLEEVEALRDPKVRNTAVAAVQALLELYGEALTRILHNSQQLAGEPLLRAFAEDDLVSHLLLLHDLHPTDLQTRVEQALAEVRPYLESQGGDVELLGVAGETVRLKLLGSCHGCGNSTAALKSAVEQAIYEAAPDVAAIEMEDPSAKPGAFVSIESLLQGV
jgi:Fe-S cluster biogenesis protein NfuA